MTPYPGPLLTPGSSLASHRAEGETGLGPLLPPLSGTHCMNKTVSDSPVQQEIWGTRQCRVPVVTESPVVTRTGMCPWALVPWPASLTLAHALLPWPGTLQGCLEDAMNTGYQISPVGGQQPGPRETPGPFSKDRARSGRCQESLVLHAPAEFSL